MKKFLLFAVFSVFITACGVGSYSVQSGVEDVAYVSFTDKVKKAIVVEVDGVEHTVNTVKQVAHKTDRNIKQTSLNSIRLTPGQHHVKVFYQGVQVFDKKLFLSIGETKIINL